MDLAFVLGSAGWVDSVQNDELKVQKNICRIWKPWKEKIGNIVQGRILHTLHSSSGDKRLDG